MARRAKKERIVVWYDVFAYFPCNASGVRVATRRSPEAAQRFMANFTKKNRVGTGCRVRLTGHVR